MIYVPPPPYGDFRPTTLEERERYGMLWVQFESKRPTTGRMWTREQLELLRQPRRRPLTKTASEAGGWPAGDAGDLP